MKYSWQCPAGHSGEIPENSRLEYRAKKRAANGFLDAICLSDKECPQCQEDRIEHLRAEVRVCDDAGCPMAEGDCKNGCMAAIELRQI